MYTPSAPALPLTDQQQTSKAVKIAGRSHKQPGGSRPEQPWPLGGAAPSGVLPGSAEPHPKPQRKSGHPSGFSGPKQPLGAPPTPSGAPLLSRSISWASPGWSPCLSVHQGTTVHSPAHSSALSLPCSGRSVWQMTGTTRNPGQRCARPASQALMQLRP